VDRLAPRPRDGPGQRGDGPRRLRRRRAGRPRRHDPLLTQGRRLLRAHRRAGRCAARVPGALHLRLVPAAAVPGAAARRPAAGLRHRLGLAPRGAGRPALVPPLPRRAHGSGAPAALDRPRSDLELPVRGVPLDRPAQGLRSRERQLRHTVERDRRRLRGVSRSGLRAPHVGPSRAGVAATRGGREQGPGARPRRRHRRLVERSGVRPAAPHRRGPGDGTDPDLRPLPLAPGTDLGRRAARRPTARQPPPGAARGPPVLPRRPDQGRGLRLRLVHPEPHAPRRRDLRRLPRSALARAARRGQRGVHPLPSRRALRPRRPPPPPARLGRRELHRLPHARAYLHGGGPARRPRPAGAARAGRLPRSPAGPAVATRRRRTSARRSRPRGAGQQVRTSACSRSRAIRASPGSCVPAPSRACASRRWRRSAR
jgi:hypothetical protein